jgi:hypothetical protein
MHRILIWPNFLPAGYPANLKGGYPIYNEAKYGTGYPDGFSFKI